MISIMHLLYMKSMHENLGGHRGYLALAYLWFQSDFPRLNLSIEMVGLVGVEIKNDKGVEQ